MLSNRFKSSLSLTDKSNSKISYVVATYNHEVRLDDLNDTPLIELFDISVSCDCVLLGGFDASNNIFCFVPLSLVMSPRRSRRQ